MPESRSDAAGSSQSPLPSWLGDLLLGIDHVGIAVDDLDAELRRWSALGLREQHRETNHDQQVVEVMLQVGPGSSRVQLVSPLTTGSDDAASPVARFLHRRGPGLHHLAYTVADLDRAARRLATAGVPLLYPVPRIGTANSLINFIHPRYAGGVLTELVQPGSATG